MAEVLEVHQGMGPSVHATVATPCTYLIIIMRCVKAKCDQLSKMQ